MTNKNEKEETGTQMRRQFLKLGVVAVVGGAGYAVITPAFGDDDVDGLKDKSTRSGYRETQHIRDYYDSL